MKTLKYKTMEIDENGNEKIKTDLLRIQNDASKHITSTLGKEKGYSNRTEVTGKNGGAVMFMPTEVIEKINDNSTQ